MPDQEDGGIVKHYVEMFGQLGAKSQGGEEVSQRVLILVENAVKHLEMWQTGETKNNKSKLIEQLRRQADLLADAAPAQSKVMTNAAELLEDL
ncbi:hypothetical protein [Caballeronia cordobensis]|uniref:hypothetical protein n=1 Tax=Caballeronia cordobensis TaxID=1353886 RepID=UPI0006AD655F|nr:hypothetical protein [Caballeronia cordobensis]